MNRTLGVVILAALGLTACDDGPRYQMITVQGVGQHLDITHQSEFDRYGPIIIRGTGFGQVMGRVTIDGHPIEVQRWEPRRIVFSSVLVNHRQNGILRVMIPNGEEEIELQGPELLLLNDRIRQRYEEYIDRYAEENGLDNDPDFPGWADWMKGNDPYAGYYQNSLQRQMIENKRIVISYNYHLDRPLTRNRDWELNFERDQTNPETWETLQEVEHMMKLEDLLEAAYPGYHFQVVKGLEKEEADIVVYTNRGGQRNESQGPTRIDESRSDANYHTIKCVLDVTLIHEIGHYLLGTNQHHCGAENCNLEVVIPGQHMPPTTLEQVQECTMDQGPSGQWCNACAAGLGIPREAWTEARNRSLSNLKRAFNGRYRSN